MDFPGGSVVKNQEPWIQSLVWEDPTCRGATKPVHHNYGARALETASCDYGAYMPRAGAPQPEEPLPREACAPQL